MLGNPHYYRSTIRNYVIAFGSMFNDIDIKRTNSSGAVLSTINVPLAYGPTQKYLSRINKVNQDGEPALVLPRMSFEIAGFAYGSERKLSKVGKITRQNHSSDDNKMNLIYNPVPYDISFTLSVSKAPERSTISVMFFKLLSMSTLILPASIFVMEGGTAVIQL